jgi:hypothetical protein
MVGVVRVLPSEEELLHALSVPSEWYSCPGKEPSLSSTRASVRVRDPVVIVPDHRTKDQRNLS